MPKIGRRASCVISLVLSVFTMAAIVVAACFMPRIVTALAGTKAEIPEAAFYVKYPFLLTIAYLILADGLLCDIVLLRLLLSIRRGEVFSARTVECIRAVSWGCIAASFLFALLTPKFFLSAAVAFVAFFVGLSLRIVKNAFEEACAIKEENDFTV